MIKHFISSVAILLALTPSLFAENYHKSAELTKIDSSNSDYLISVVKNMRINGYQNATFGEAFETYRYFSKKEWKSIKLDNGKVYVDFRGYFNKKWFDFSMMGSDVVQRGIEVKFVIYPNSKFEVAMVSSLDVISNGSISTKPYKNGLDVLELVLRNKEVSVKN